MPAVPGTTGPKSAKRQHLAKVHLFFFEDVQYTFSLREEKEIQRSDFWGT
jgi:hypothetical protein